MSWTDGLWGLAFMALCRHPHNIDKPLHVQVVSIQGRAHSFASLWVPSSSQAQSPSQEISRCEGTTAPHWHGCSTLHPSQAQSTGSVQCWECLCAPQRVKGQTPAHSPSRHEHSHRRDEPLQHSWVFSMVVIPPAHIEATSIKWPWMGSSMRGSHPMHRNSHHRGGQPQQHQTPPQRVQYRARHIPRLLQGVPTGMSHLCWSHHAPTYRHAAISHFQLPSTATTLMNNPWERS